MKIRMMYYMSGLIGCIMVSSGYASFFSWFAKDSQGYRYYKSHEIIHKEYSLDATSMVDIVNQTGAVTIKTWDEPKIMVEAAKHAISSQALKDINVVIDVQNTKADIQTILKKDGWFNGAIKGIVNYTIMVPKNVHIKVHMGSGVIDIEGIQGSVRTSLNAGTIRLSRVSGILNAHNGAGKIAIQCAPDRQNTITAIGGTGTIEIIGSTGSVKASSTTGSITVMQSKLATDAMLDIHTSIGAIKVGLPHDVNTMVSIGTNMGSIASDFAILEQPSTQRGWFAKKIEGTIGTSGAQVSLSTTMGNIKIIKS